MIVYTAPDQVPFGLPMCDSVFLAGSIENGKASDWQNKVLKALSTQECVVFNPRRRVWNPDVKQDISDPELYEQVNWELDQLERADVVFFFFEAGTLSPITLLELGKILERAEERDIYPVVVCEPGFWRRGNVQITCARNPILPVPVYDSLEEGIEALLDLVQPD